MLSSPPLRISRSPGGTSSQSSWESDYKTLPPIPRNKYNSPRRNSQQPLPPLPSSPMFSPAPALPSRSYFTPPPTVAYRSHAPSPIQPRRASTPPPRSMSKSSSKLLPALPLSINTDHAIPSSRSISRNTGVGEDSPYDGIQITVNENDAVDFGTSTGSSRARRSSGVSPLSSPTILSPRPVPVKSTPPRPARRINTEPSDLVPPQPYFRASSPSGSSISTVTGDTTPRMIPPPERTESAPPTSNVSLVTATTKATSTPMGNKRDSAQRRLSALRGLVANLDFNQHWSISEKTEPGDGEVFWACGEPDTEVDVEVPQEQSYVVQVEGPVSQIPSIPPSPERKVSQDHGWPSPPKSTSQNVLETTPIRQASLPRRPVSTPPRRPRLLSKSSSELLSRTPDPPRPSKQRMENYGVASSGYNKSLEQPLSPRTAEAQASATTWQSSLSTDLTFQELLQAQGKLEVKRQEVMWEMCETEQAFVKSMRTVLRLFAIPLKTPQGKWIDGIPHMITELFDSLECVAHAHGIIAAAQRDMRRKSETLDTLAFTAMFKTWVNRLEVHEWYLLKFESVVQLVEDNVRDPGSVFGEFVRMQMKDEVLGSMSLGSMLLKPVQRLTKYPLFLKRLLDVTPHPHPAQPELLSLLSTTESIILRLQATKAREEDFERLQVLEARLHGLPDDFTLAVRGRKLIRCGQVSRVLPGKDIASSLAPRSRADSLHSSRGSISSSVTSSSASSSPWDFSISTPSTGRTSAFSVSSASSGYPPSRSGSISQCGSSPRPGISRSPSTASSVASEHRCPSSISSRTRRKDESLTMFIFDDLVIVAAPLSEKNGLFGNKKKAPKSAMRVLSENDGGIGKVLEVKDWSGWQNHTSLFALTTVPLSYTARSPLVSPVTTAYTLPGPASPRRASVSSSNNCPTLSTVPQFLSTLAQATTAASGMILSEYKFDEGSGFSLESIGEAHEWSDSSMGYAQ